MLEKMQSLLVFVIVSLWTVSGCGAKSTVSIDSAFELKFGKSATEIKKNVLYQDLTEAWKREGSPLACVLESDQPAAVHIAETYNELVKKYPDPIVFSNDITSASAKVSHVADLARTNLGSPKAPIFWATDPIITSCKPTGLDRFNAPIVETSSTQGIVKVEAVLVQSCDWYIKNTGKKGTSDYKAKIVFDINYALASPDHIKFEVRNLSYERSAYSNVDEKAIAEMIKNIPASHRPSGNLDKLDELKRYITWELSDRIYYKRFITASKTYKAKTEKIYNLEFNASVSRIQRNLERYKFDPKESTLTFEDQKGYEYCPPQAQGKSYPARRGEYRVRTLMKLFPESKGRTAVVFEMDHGLIHDSLLEKDLGEDESAAEFKSLISAVDRILK